MTGDKTVDHAAAVKLARKFPGLKGMDLAKVVTTKRSFQWNEGTVWPDATRLPIRSHQRLHVVAYDFGIKRNILRLLADFGCRVTVVPAQTSAEEVLALAPDGVFLSNGPGDPEPCDYAITATKELLETTGRATAGIRHLSRSPDTRSRQRREDREDEDRSPRREPPRAGSRFRPRLHHESESRFRGRRVDAARRT